jgi:outer membrane murein-binding lipoprotein Lpp
MKRQWFKVVTGISMVCVLVLVGCASEKKKNQAKEAAARYWQDKAYPGKGFDIQVVEAEKADGGVYRVKGIVDGETRVGTFNPDTETFSEGYYSLAHERNKRIAELEQESKFWKEKAEALEKENYKLKVRLNMNPDKSGDGK